MRNSYSPLVDALDTPFAKAGDREWAWTSYSALLQRRVDEGIFDEPFKPETNVCSFERVYYENKTAKELIEEMARTGRQRKRVVVSLQNELEQWLQKASPQDSIRVISGGLAVGSHHLHASSQQNSRVTRN